MYPCISVKCVIYCKKVKVNKCWQLPNKFPKNTENSKIERRLLYSNHDFE